MRLLHGTGGPERSSLWLLPCLLAGLATANGAGPAEPQAAAAPTRYRVINLGTGDLSELPVINSKGQVSFSMQSGAGSRGYFYDGTVTTDIGTLGGPGTNAVDLNDAGQVTGRSMLSSGLEHGFVWRSGSGMVDLGVLPGASASAGAAINNRGVVAGTSSGSLTPPHAFRWSATSGIEDLGAFTAGIASFSSATLINDADLIAGNSDTAAMNRAGFVWTRASGLIDISGPGGGDAYPYALGPKDQVAGAFSGPANGYLYHAFVWTRASGMLDLGTAGGTESFVLAMNPQMQAAGVIDFGTDRQHAMSWTRTGGMRDLGTLGGLQSRAIDINGKGQIVGSADNAGGDSRAFLWSASQGMIDLNTRLRDAPAGLALDDALAINDEGAIVATSNAGLVLLEPDDGGTGTYALGPIEAADMVKVGAPLAVSLSLGDAGGHAVRGVTWSWGDGSAGAGSATASHSYAAPGIYSVRATVVDAAGRSAAVGRKVIVYDPSGGVVVGSGSVVSPPGAIGKAPGRSARASFSFLSGAGARLHVDLPGLSFRSASLKPVALKGADGQFEGSGTINGAGDYKFSLSTTAGKGGRFDLKVWHADPVTHKEVVDYDSRGARAGAAGGALVAGRILRE